MIVQCSGKYGIGGSLRCFQSHSALLITQTHYVAPRCYGPLVQEYLAHFDPEQLLVVTLDEYKVSPKDTLARVFRHLGVHDPSEDEWAHILGRRKVKQQP